jgi:hypothetical protein
MTSSTGGDFKTKGHDLVWGPEYYSDGQGGIGDAKT